ncbi:DUF6012 family protein [Bacillus velezensis]|uniref:DUF6012 family protein n=1 Tax=Bacillus velezensis TaxID=492670 RepID=UPI0024173514|nr:DUF6012 family protein [Bacillus velezensis]WFP05436.1 hypothetical protein JEQ22_20220 [Bacillus velezensis]
MDKAFVYLLRELNYYDGTPIMEERILKEVLLTCKRERKNLSKDEIKEKGLNIYEKQGIRVSELLNEAINRGLAGTLYNSYGERKVFISREGIDFLIRHYTNNFSCEYMQFEKEINQMMREHGELELGQSQSASLFWHGETVKSVYDFYTESTIQKESAAYHNYLLEMNGVKDKIDRYIFHFMPKIFLPIELVSTEVENIGLQIEGIKTPSEMILTKPYPNTRYVVAGRKFGREKTSAGFYPIIAAKEDFPEELDITLRWSIGEYTHITHKLRINFAFEDHAGSFFSSEQHLSRQSKLDEFSITTFFEDEIELYRDRDYSYQIKETDEIVIEENVKLTHFPIKMHFAFHADPHFSKWRKKSGFLCMNEG